MNRVIVNCLCIFFTLATSSCITREGGPDDAERTSEARSSDEPIRPSDSTETVAGIEDVLQTAGLGPGETRMKPQPEPWSGRSAKASTDPSNPSDPSDVKPLILRDDSAPLHPRPE